MEKVLILIDNKKYPFYKTMRGVLEFAESGFTSQQMLEGNVRAILQFIFCYMKGACNREDIAFDFDFETFVNKVDNNAMARVEAFLTSQAETEEPDSAKKKQ